MEPQPMPHELQTQKEEATQFVKENIVEARDGRVCVDGRYAPDGESAGFLARAGGDFGYVMGLMALGVNPIQSVDMVYGFIKKSGGTFSFHTDTKSLDEQTLTGCGHIAKSTISENAEKYMVAREAVEEALSYLRNNELHRDANEVILEGEHLEKGVLIVKAKGKTLRHQDGGSQYFVYDKDRDDEFVEALVEDMNLEDITAQSLKEILEQQTNATVALLAAGKPVFEVDLTEDQPKTTYLATVPQAS